ncbi:hypothetical protein OAH99_00490 [Planktomarina sp.]|nr:hypothetical protein [Planktomarina sp.]
MYRKLFATNNGLKLGAINYPEISRHDVLIEVISSFFSLGTEKASLSNIQKSKLEKALKFRRQITDLLLSGDVGELVKKAKAQSNISASTGYSVFGRVIAVGNSVDNVKEGQYVVGVGPNANHSALTVVPMGLVTPVEYNPDFSAAALVAIALNAIEVANFKPFSRVCILGGGLLGQLTTQIAAKSGCIVDVMDIDASAKNISLANGANRFLTDEAFGTRPEIYDGFVSTVPTANQVLWEKVEHSAKDYARVVLVGAADLSVSRSIFYNKKLSFHPAYSYGVGRGDYEFETQNLRAREYTGRFTTLDALIEKSINLIRLGIVEFSATKRIDVLSNAFDHNFASGNNARSGILLLWSRDAQKKPVVTQKLLPAEQETTDKLLLDVVGNSAYFRDSHKPALAELKIPVNNLKSRTPAEVDDQLIIKGSNSLLISTPHDEHWPTIQKYPAYKYFFVDKPLLISKIEYEDYKQTEKIIVGLMNRRYSLYTQKIIEFLNQFDNNLIKIEFTFSVPLKSNDDPIFGRGGRIVGEMCHHLDLAIFLNGPVSEVNSINFDADRTKWRNERHILVIKHANERTSIIKYWPENSPFFEKEAILATALDKYLLIKDFLKIESNMGAKVARINEKDKGCYEMWKKIKNSIENKTENLNDMINIDRQTYAVLAEVCL